MAITIVEVEPFLRQAEAFLTSEQLDELRWHLAMNPSAGAVIPGTGGVRKLRWQASGRGKRGGCRVIYYYHDDRMPLWLLAAYAKNVKTDLSSAEKLQITGLVRRLAAHYRREQER